MRAFLSIIAACVIPGLGYTDDPDVVQIEGRMVHLRGGEEREWSSFPQSADSQSLEKQFQSTANEHPWTLSLRQQDVKEGWEVRLNDKMIGRLVRDENDLRTDFSIPRRTIVSGENTLQIRQSGSGASDDIRVGQIRLFPVTPQALRSGATIQIQLRDDSDMPLPGRITIVDQAGTLIPVGTESGDGLAVREGVVYTANGSATFGVQPGKYRIFATRGFEYSVASTEVTVMHGQRAKRTLNLQRQVDTGGWVACDTHVHTVTHSGHGDCTIEERMVTLAGEGIEFPIATDHNKHIDYGPIASAVGVDTRFTAVIGNEVTTKQGHFNIFPVVAGSETPDHTQNDWGPLLDDIFATPNVRVAILNHARDIHSGFRPFSPRHHISLTGENLDEWPRRFNAMEVINSGAVQTDPMELFTDWCGLINHGLSITPVGSSDSHDVARYIVGQGRTYIQVDDSDVGQIDVDAAVDAFLQGRVIVSYGLLARLVVQQSNGPGDLVTFHDDDDEMLITAQVHGPQWIEADSIELYVNGRRRFQHPLESSSGGPVSLKGTVSWRIPRSELAHDVWVTAVAKGKGVSQPYWKTAKPYQPDSPQFQPYSFSSTGPVWVDIDGDGRYTSPRQYAKRIVQQCTPEGDSSTVDGGRLVSQLEGFDISVTQQVMSLLQAATIDLAAIQEAATGERRKAIADYRQAWRQSVSARLEQTE